LKCQIRSQLVSNVALLSTVDAAGPYGDGGEACGEWQLFLLRQSRRWPMSPGEVQRHVPRLPIWAAGESVRVRGKTWEGEPISPFQGWGCGADCVSIILIDYHSIFVLLRCTFNTI